MGNFVAVIHPYNILPRLQVERMDSEASIKLVRDPEFLRLMGSLTVVKVVDLGNHLNHPPIL